MSTRRALPATLLTLALAAAPPPTRFERSGGLETPRLAETVEECRALAEACPWVRVGSFGRSPQGRDLPLVVVDKDRAFEPAQARAKGRAVVMIQACIHAGECDGKDAGLLFLRELCLGGSPILDRVTFVFLPVFNVDGHERFGPFNRINQDGPKEMGWRASAAGLNLNRDYLKADTPEMRAWLKLYDAWRPDLFIDCHATDGADYQYVMTHGSPVGKDSDGFLDHGLAGWVRSRLLPGFRAGLEADGFPVTGYVTFRNWHDPRSGLVAGAATPRYSDGYASAQNRAGLLLETHMLKPYKLRVEATRAALKHCAELVARDRDDLLRLAREADAYAASPAFRARPMALGLAADASSEPVAFKGFEYTAERSELTGGTWFRYDRTRPATFTVPLSAHLQVTASASLPEAYLVPPEWTDVIARLEAHGIAFHRLAQARELRVRAWRLRNPRWEKAPFEGRIRLAALDQEEVTVTRSFPAGTAVVPTAQRAVRVLAHLLEPASDDSLLRWGFFNTVFEQKEYGESYVLEGLARRMLAGDPALKAEYEKRKTEDPAFAQSPLDQLNWFYLRSPWGDPGLDLYPVGRVFEPEVAKGL